MNEDILRHFSSIVTGHSKKIIAAVILFSLLMGYFATGLQMQTREEAFNPDTPKSNYLTYINEEFGTSDNIAQIIFTADNGDVFTTDALTDMLNVKQALLQNQSIQRTLSHSPRNPTGITTLADTILTAHRLQEIQQMMLQKTQYANNRTTNMSHLLEKQQRLYASLDTTVALCNSLLSSPHEKVQDAGTHMLTALSALLTNPSAMQAIEQQNHLLTEYRNVLANGSRTAVIVSTGLTATTIKVLTSPAAQRTTHAAMELTEQIENATRQWPALKNLTAILKESLEKVKIDTDQRTALQGMATMLTGMNTVLTDRKATEGERQTARDIVLHVMGNVDTVQSLSLDNQSSLSFSFLDFSGPEQQLNMTLQEKKQRLCNMTNADVKATVRHILTYSSETFDQSTAHAVSNINHLAGESERTASVIHNVSLRVEDVQSRLHSRDRFGAARQLAGFQEHLQDNRSTFTTLSATLDTSASKLQSVQYLPSQLQQLKNGIAMSISTDAAISTEAGDVSAQSCLGMVRMNASLDDAVLLQAQQDITHLARQESDTLGTKVFGSHLMNEEINESTHRTLTTLLPIAFLFVVAVLFLVYRTFIETVLSFGSLICAIIWTVGIGVLLGFDFNVMTIAVPILITGLVIDYGIHLVMRYREEKRKGHNPWDATTLAITTVGGALLLTTVTTAIGFLSNMFSSIQVMKNFGILAAVGITSSFVIMVGFLPATINEIEKRRKNRAGHPPTGAQGNTKKSKVQDLLSRIGDAPYRHPVFVLLLISGLTLSAAYGAAHVDTTFSMQDFLPENQPQKENIQHIRENFNISTSYAYVLIEGDVATPSCLQALDQTATNMQDDELLLSGDGLSSPLTVLREYGTAPAGSPMYNATVADRFAASDTDGDLVPDRNISNLFDLYYETAETRDAMAAVVTRNTGQEYTAAVIKVKENEKLIEANVDRAADMEHDLQEDIQPLQADNFNVELTSNSMIIQQTTEELESTLIASLMATVSIIAVLLTIVFYRLHGSLALGVITTIPVTLVTIWILATMFILGVPLNIMTVTITALTVGMGVAYGIHVTHRYMEENEEERNVYRAMHTTIKHTGGALFGSATTTMGAFSILSFSNILLLSRFGYITAIAIGYSFLVSVFVLPAILMLREKYQKRRKKSEIT